MKQKVKQAPARRSRRVHPWFSYRQVRRSQVLQAVRVLSVIRERR